MHNHTRLLGCGTDPYVFSDRSLNVLSNGEYRKLLVLVFPNGLPGHESQDAYLIVSSIKAFDELPPSVCLLADSSFLTVRRALWRQVSMVPEPDCHLKPNPNNI